MGRNARRNTIEARTVPPVVRRARPDDYLPRTLWLSLRSGLHSVDFDSVLRPQTVQLPDSFSVYLPDLGRATDYVVLFLHQ